MLLGKSSHYRQILSTSRLEAKLALVGLHILWIIPIFMAFSRVGAEVLCAVLGLMFLYRSYRFKNWHWVKQPPVLVALALWAYSVVISTPFAVDPMAALSRLHWVRFILLFAAIVYWLSDYREEMRRVAAVIMFLLVLAAGDATYQFFTGASLDGTPYIGERLNGPFDKTVIGSFLTKMSIPCIGLLFYYAWVEKKKWNMLALLATQAGLFTIILTSNERTATLTFLLGMALVGAGLFFTYKKTRIPVLLGVALVIAIIGAIYHSQPTMQRRVYFTQELLRDFSSSTYAQLWKGSLYVAQERPLTGVGMANFRKACPPLIDQQRINYCSEHPHNIYLEWLSELGVLGVAGFIVWIAGFAVAVCRRRTPPFRDGNILIFFALAGMVVNLFPFAVTQSFFSNWPALLLWQSLAWSLAITRMGEEKT